MNPLEILKEKLKYKPIIGEKKQVAVIIKGNKPVIVDETYNEFPRQTLLDNFEKSGITKVTMKPVLKATVKPIIVEEVPVPKKAKMMGKKKLKILEEIEVKEV